MTAVVHPGWVAPGELESVRWGRGLPIGPGPEAARV